MRLMLVIIVLVTLQNWASANTVTELNTVQTEELAQATSSEECHVIAENFDDLSETLTEELYDQCEDTAY